MSVQTHVAGADVEICGRYLLQRCAWCGAVLLAYDLSGLRGVGRRRIEPSTFKVGSLVRYDVNESTWFAEQLDIKELPEDACVLTMPFEIVSARA